jgi:hypothetical protein
MTQDVYMGRAVDSPAALALDVAWRDAPLQSEKHGKTMADDEGQTP